MFAIANPNASLFQRASGRARQMRQRLLRQHGWALAMRRRMSADCREPGAARAPLRPRTTGHDETREALLIPAHGALAPLSPEPVSPSLALFY